LLRRENKAFYGGEGQGVRARRPLVPSPAPLRFSILQGTRHNRINGYQPGFLFGYLFPRILAPERAKNPFQTQS